MGPEHKHLAKRHLSPNAELPGYSPQPSADEVHPSIAVSRVPRYVSHALVDIGPQWWNPFLNRTAVLLDLSTQGFKIEFTSRLNVKPGGKIRMEIPLEPFQVMTPKVLKLRAILKWCDPNRLRAGGVFLKLSDFETHIIDKVITHLELGNAKTY
jgi:hypothetical protein